MKYATIKSFFDKLFALIFLIIFLPFLLLISILILVLMGKPIFFIQERTGKNKKIFKLIKFRTMIKSFNCDDNNRITFIGKILRSTSLDEIPQLINIFIGNMSFVGPRPLLKEYIPLYSTYENRRHEVMPGLTGLAQINGRNALSWNAKFKYDVDYTKKQSFFLDFLILIKTFVVVFLRIGISHNKGKTMPRFEGSNMKNKKK